MPRSPSARAAWQPLAGRRAVLLLLLLALGCAAVRTPVSSVASLVPVRGGIAEPQLELWLESGGKVAPADARAAAEKARAVLRRALARRDLTEGDQLLVVRAQGVARDEARRDGQELAAGAALTGATVVILLSAVSGQDPGLAFDAEAAPSLLPAPRRGASPEVLPRARRPPAVRQRRTLGAGAATSGADGPQPGALAPLAADDGIAALEPPEPAATEILLPPLPPFPLEDRGFWSRDAVRVELFLVDRKTGTPLWSKMVAEESDLRDIARMKALLDGALDDPSGWEPAPPPGG